MMQFTRAIAVALTVTMMGSQAIDAKTLRNDGAPAELPPLSFSGNQYVDSRGCVFVRAGVNGGTNWVPRVTRDRKLVCGFQPTLSAAERQNAAQPETVVQITPAATPAAVKGASSISSQPAKVPVVTASQDAARATVVRPSATVQTARSIAVKPYEPMADLAPTVVTSTRTTALPERVINRQPRRGDVVRQGEVADTVRVVPRHVYENRGNANPRRPSGYNNVWKDDRLNPKRAEQTFAGKAKMDAIWTQTVPRRLIKVPARDTTTK